MPAYFDVDFELNKSETAIRSFCDALLYAGLSFKSGFLEFDADSLSDIIRWNQAKLEQTSDWGRRTIIPMTTNKSCLIIRILQRSGCSS